MLLPPLVALMFTTAVALTGCGSPLLASAGVALAAAKQQAGAENAQSFSTAMADHQEMEDYGYLAEDAEAGYALRALAGAAAAAMVAAEGVSASGFRGPLSEDVRKRLTARHAELKALAQPRLNARMIEREALKRALARAPWVDNQDGTKTKTLEFSVTKTVGGKVATKAARLARTVNTSSRVLVSADTRIEQALPSGQSRTASRSKTLQPDGSYAIVFDTVHTQGSGATRTMHWEKTVGIEGALFGAGTLTFRDAAGAVLKTLTLGFGGTDARTVGRATDETTGTTTEITTDVEGRADATVKDDATGASASVAVAAD